MSAITQFSDIGSDITVNSYIAIQNPKTPANKIALSNFFIFGVQNFDYTQIPNIISEATPKLSDDYNMLMQSGKISYLDFRTNLIVDSVNAKPITTLDNTLFALWDSTAKQFKLTTADTLRQFTFDVSKLPVTTTVYLNSVLLIRNPDNKNYQITYGELFSQVSAKIDFSKYVNNALTKDSQLIHTTDNGNTTNKANLQNSLFPALQGITGSYYPLATPFDRQGVAVVGNISSAVTIATVNYPTPSAGTTIKSFTVPVSGLYQLYVYYNAYNANQTGASDIEIIWAGSTICKQNTEETSSRWELANSITLLAHLGANAPYNLATIFNHSGSGGTFTVGYLLTPIIYTGVTKGTPSEEVSQ